MSTTTEELTARICKLKPIPTLTPVALAARYGFRLLPLRPNSKLPFEENFPEKATSDKTKLQKIISTGTPYNFGISLVGLASGKVPVVLDIDMKNGKNGLDVVKLFEAEGKSLPPTYTQRTASGAFHLVYLSDKPLSSNLTWKDRGLEILTGRRQIVAAGSKIDGKSYEIIDDRAPADAPTWLIELCGPKKDSIPKEKPTTGKEINLDRAISRASEWLSNFAPLAIENQGGDHTTFSVAAKVKDFGCDEVTCLDLLLDTWNPRCQPPWSPEELRQKVRNAYSYGTNEMGTDAPELEFEPVPEEPLPDWLEADNKAFAVVNENGNMLVYRFRHDFELGHEVIEKRSFEDHKKWGRNKRVRIGSALKNRGEAWLDHPKHREYDGVAFVPAGNLPENILNLWSGLNVKPQKGEWPRIQKHIRDVICDGDSTSYEYIMGWLARMVQRPWEQGEVALILRGGRGVGKGVFAGLFKKIFGRHSMHLTNSKHLVGNFNSHLREAVFVFMDEAFFAGDVAHESILKGLVTEATFISEAKYQNANTVRNYTHILAASNEGWVVPAGENERRFCVLDCSDKHQQDPNYFGPLIAEAQNGGIEAMLHDLLSYDLSNFDVRRVPQTKALDDQKLRTLRGTAAWLYECLKTEAIGAVDWNSKGCSVAKNRARESYMAFCQAKRWHRMDDVGVWAKTVKGILGSRLSEARKKIDEMSDRQRAWELRGIEECREAFDLHFKMKSDHWNDDKEPSDVFD